MALPWSFRSRVGKTEDGNRLNGNPPAMVRLADGRLCCAYGTAAAAGLWQGLAMTRVKRGPERILRDDFPVRQWLA